MASEGAKIVVSSRKEANVKSAIDNLKKQGYKDIIGTVCHVAKQEDRENLLKKVKFWLKIV